MSKKIYQFFLMAAVGLVVLLGTTMWTKADGGNTSPRYAAWQIATSNNMPGDVSKLYAINSTNFPDEHFRTSISRDLDRNNDGYLSTKEVREAVGFSPQWDDYYYREIASMKGMEKFTNLKTLNITNMSNLGYFDVSKNTNLEYVYLNEIFIDSLDFSANSKLENLYINYCSLNSLTLCQNGSLQYLNISGNENLESLSIPDSVVNLDCSYNSLKTLNFSANSLLEYLYCPGNKISSIDLAKLKNLSNLNCWENEITELVFPSGSKIESLYCQGNSTLQTLNLRNATELEYLTCGNCNLSTLDVSKCTKLEWLSASNNPLTSLNVSKNTVLRYLDIQNTDIDAIDIRNCPTLMNYYREGYGQLLVDADTAVIYQDAPVITDLYQEGSNVYVIFSIVPGAEGYALYRKTSAGVLEFVAHCDMSAGDAQFTYIQPVTNVGENYTYMVQCENYDLVPTSWMSKGKSIVEQTVINNPALNAVNNGSGIKLTWAKNADTSKYRIYRAVGNGALVAVAKVGTNSYVDTNVTNGTKYTYEVRCLAANGNEIGKYNQKKITASGIYPVPKANVSVEGNAIKVTWDAVDGIAKYRVMRKEEGGSFAALAKLSGTSYTDKNIESGKKYYYTIRLMDSTGAYVGSYDKNGTSITAPVIIAAPTVSLSNETAGIKVTWAAVDGISKYRVMRKVEGGDFVAYAKVSGTSYTDKNVEAGKTYTYTVRCLDDVGKYVGTYDETGKSLSRVVPLPAPVVTLTNTSEGVKVTWNAIDGAAKYRVLRMDVTGGFVALGKVAGTEYVDKTSESGETYRYTVRCVDEAGKYIGTYNEEGVEIVCNKASQQQQQINISAAESGANGITLIWQDPPADGVKIRVLRKVGDGAYEPIGKTANMYYIDKNVEKGVTYTYTLRLIGPDGKYFRTYDETGFTITCQ